MALPHAGPRPAAKQTSGYCLRPRVLSRLTPAHEGMFVMRSALVGFGLCLTLLGLLCEEIPAQKQKPKAKPVVTFSPTLPDRKAVVTAPSADFLKPTGKLRDGVVIAKAPPTVDFLYFPGQTYEGKPWSNWGDSLAVGDKYYASIGDHLAPAGNAFVYEYDPATKQF